VNPLSRVRPWLAVVAATSVVVAAGCSGGTDESADAAASSTVAGETTSTAPVVGRELAWDVSLTSQQRILRQVGPAGEMNYGWNQLVGPSTVDGQAVDVEMLGNVDYEQGTGPFFGFVSLVWPNGDVLAFRMDGQATQPAAAQGSSDSAFAAELTVIGGSGTYAGVSGGRGTFTGSRSAELGGQVVGTMTATVAGL
jgi:hypothetical protein